MHPTQLNINQASPEEIAAVMLEVLMEKPGRFLQYRYLVDEFFKRTNGLSILSTAAGHQAFGILIDSRIVEKHPANDWTIKYLDPRDLVRRRNERK